MNGYIEMKFTSRRENEGVTEDAAETFVIWLQVVTAVSFLTEFNFWHNIATSTNATPSAVVMHR